MQPPRRVNAVSVFLDRMANEFLCWLAPAFVCIVHVFRPAAVLYRGIALDGFIETAFDPTGEPALSDMLGEGYADFRPIACHDLNLGFVRAAGWMRFAMPVPAGTDKVCTVLLSILPNCTDVIDVYVAVAKPNLLDGDFFSLR